MASSFSVRDTSLWPTLGQTIADLAHAEVINRETLGAGVMARSMDRMNGMAMTGAPSVVEDIFGGMVAGRYLDTLSAGPMSPRDAVEQTYDVQRGMMTLYTGNGGIIDRMA